jgi:adenylate cyclase
MSQQRHLAAILFTDIVGYTGLMQESEQNAVELIRHYNVSLNSIVALHEGKVMNYYGDGSLCTFPSATEALNCAIDLQKELQSDPHVPLRIGLHIGEVLYEDGKALGDGVNVASRVQSLGQANTILFSREMHDKIKNHPEFKSVSLGLFDFRNVDEPMEVFALANEGLVVPKKEQMSGKLKHNLGKRKKSIRKRIALAFYILVMLIVGVYIFSRYFNKQNSTVDNSIAVIPFLNMSNDIQQEYFAEGMMDEILNHLYKIGGLNVISRTSSMAYKDSKKTAREIASELGVGNILEGSVQKDGDRIRIRIQLINGKTDEHLWAETYNREFKDIFAIQSEIAKQVAASLKVKIDAGTESRIEYVPTENTSAYNLYLQANSIAITYGKDEDWKKLLERVILLDPSFAPAYADIGFYWLIRGIYSGNLDSKQVLDSALPFFRKSLQLDSNLAAAHNYMAQVHLWYEWDFKAAKQEWEIFSRLNPSGAIWEDNYLNFLNAAGRSREALDFAWKYSINDKHNYAYPLQMAITYVFLNQADKGIKICDSVNSLFKPGDGNDVFWYKALLYTYLGKYQKVIDNLDTLFEIHPSDKIPRSEALLSISYFHTGRLNEADQILDNLKLASQKSPVRSPSYYIAMIYSITGRQALALQWLEKAYTTHEVEMYWLNVEPLFNSLRNDPRFKELLTKIGFK